MPLFKKEYVSVYCQDCGTDITDVGGEITEIEENEFKNIYCSNIIKMNETNRGERACYANAVLKGNENPLKTISNQYHAPREVQKLIKKNILENYSKLEEKVVLK